MVASRSAAREEENRQRMRKEVDHPSEQRGSSTAANADLTSIIGQLPLHLQSMVTLLAPTISPSVEGKMMEKMGKDALQQAASMMVAVSYSSFEKTFFTFKCCVLADYFNFV